jgi:hypothetical protein
VRSTAVVEALQQAERWRQEYDEAMARVAAVLALPPGALQQFRRELNALALSVVGTCDERHERRSSSTLQCGRLAGHTGLHRSSFRYRPAPADRPGTPWMERVSTWLWW